MSASLTTTFDDKNTEASTLTNPTLVLNCGSSSIKYALISDDDTTRITGLAENLGLDTARIKHTTLNGDKLEIAITGGRHELALKKILELLEQYHFIAVGHRVVHGGREYSEAVRVDDHVLAEVKRLKVLAPLHNPANALGIEAVQAIYPEIPQVVVFDTAFHQTMPPVAFRYPLPKAMYEEHKIRRYGFHGTSHAYVSERASEITESKAPHGWLTAHLGNGCSATAVYDGKSLDTSMGLTPLEGLMMGTRSGDVDPSLHIHLKRQLGMSLEDIDTILNKESGLLGISGLSNDLRTIEQAADEGHQDAKLAIEMFCYRVAKYLASLSCALPTFTGIVFTGGIGENSVTTRTRILEMMPHFGIKVDTDKNASLVGGSEGSFHSDDSNIELWVVPTDEECRIAQETRQALNLD
ncbi:acetate/propionate family kinase [Psychrobacter sp. AOP22-C1-22]|uniref:acetate/propionate family kinase n=1 Tax=unclassified Psychrobacter TaxID=196806 RepID=UPI0017886532|nr:MULTISPECIES: acetate kinase [unclassified Psychrobacter]MDN5801932.1 acetate kinase [Psychrobacter sp.]MBE0407121.1 acetate kinase [Psychrobacter sp. FME6]MBE0445793.1 acetate kinase [Psychrobacter sp. FME5]MDN5890696.1 acetate kinase [Psychrobacter sp.]MDN5897233.1 acetate kinase [Psychrobacter sp.]